MKKIWQGAWLIFLGQNFLNFLTFLGFGKKPLILLTHKFSFFAGAGCSQQFYFFLQFYSWAVF